MLGFSAVSEFAISEITPPVTITLETSGGVIAGGDLPLLFGHILEVSGGVIAGGDLPLLFGHILEVSGGVIAGGDEFLIFSLPIRRLLVSYELINSNTTFSLGKSEIQDIALKFPLFLCILNLPRVTFTLLPVAERFKLQ